MPADPNSPREATYDDVHKLVWSLAHRHHAKTGLDFDEVVSAAHLGYAQAYQTFDPGIALFTTWVQTKVQLRLADLERDRARGKESINLEFDLLPARPEATIDVEDVLAGYSEDAAAVARLVLDPPMDVKASLIQYGRKMTPSNWRRAVREFLFDAEWPKDRVAEAFRELRGS